MTGVRPRFGLGLCHVALLVEAFEACERFYVDVLGMSVEWRPDEDNVYLSSGRDNLALHRAPPGAAFGAAQRLDHIGFAVHTAQEVDIWHDYLLGQGVEIKHGPRSHRDGARSLYCRDPDGNTVQIIFHPPLAVPP